MLKLNLDLRTNNVVFSWSSNLVTLTIKSIYVNSACICVGHVGWCGGTRFSHVYEFLFSHEACVWGESVFDHDATTWDAVSRCLAVLFCAWYKVMFPRNKQITDPFFYFSIFKKYWFLFFFILSILASHILILEYPIFFEFKKKIR